MAGRFDTTFLEIYDQRMSDQNFPANQKSSNTTLDDLAVMIKNGFDNTATKKDLAAVEQSLRKDITKLEGKVDKIDERLQIVETKLDRALYTEYVHLETRVKRLEEKIGLKPQTLTA